MSRVTSRRTLFLHGLRRTGWRSLTAARTGTTWREINEWYRDDPIFRSLYDAIERDLYQRNIR